MKKLQKSLALLLALVFGLISLTAALAACTPQEQPDETPTPTIDAQEDDVTPDVDTPDEAPDNEPVDADTPDDSVIDNSDARGSIQTGDWDGDVFTNEWVNISFNLPEGWTALTSEQLQTQMQAGMGAFEDEGTAAVQEAAMARTVYDFSVMGTLGIPNIIATYENVSFSPLTANLTANDYYETAKLQFKGAMGIALGDAEEIEIAGETYIMCSADVAAGAMFQSYYFRKLDGAMITFIATYAADGEAEIADFFASFTAA